MSCYRLRASHGNQFRHLLAVSMVVTLLGYLMAAPTSASPAAGACEEARERYARGSKLLNFSERREAFAKAVELCPDYAEAHVNLGDSYENLGDFDSAEKHYSQAVGLGLQSPAPFIGLGEVYLKTGRYGLAKESFAKGRVVEPSNERLQAGQKVADERIKREKAFFTRAQILACLGQDDEFRLMCMCPEEHHSLLRKWICMPVIYFLSGSAELSDDAVRQLDEVGESLKAKELARRKWLIIGHADNIGMKSRNISLSRNRADRVKHYLVERHGIDPSRMRVLAFGAERPRSVNETPVGRTDNRRVEIVVEDL